MIYIIGRFKVLAGEKYHPGYYNVAGYFFTRYEAEQALLLNLGDIHENGYYNRFVICEVPPGIEPIPNTQILYKFNEDRCCIVPMTDDEQENHFTVNKILYGL